MELNLYQIDAFAGKTFQGNPAAVCPLEEWLPDHLLQAIAEENNLSETAYFVPKGKNFHIRWFTPTNEVELCGHATLASAYVILNELGFDEDKVEFVSKGGELTVSRDKDRLVMDFPCLEPIPCEIPEEIKNAFAKTPVEVLKSDDYVVVFDCEEDILRLSPEMTTLKKLDLRGVVATANGKEVDFVSRFFAPKYGIEEDPVTGSAHCELTPYWAKKLKKRKFTARQLSKRGGELVCELKGSRVLISGSAVKYLEGKIHIEME